MRTAHAWRELVKKTVQRGREYADLKARIFLGCVDLALIKGWKTCSEDPCHPAIEETCQRVHVLRDAYLALVIDIFDDQLDLEEIKERMIERNERLWPLVFRQSAPGVDDV